MTTVGTADETGGRAALLEAARAELTEHGHAAISLRAVARRAGLSHSAPKHHFWDRAGMLTAVATTGFLELAEELRRGTEEGQVRQLDVLGRAYLDFGLSHAALFDLMFRPSELNATDPALMEAQREVVKILAAAVTVLGEPEPNPDAVPPMALMSWALVHGLVVLTRDRALTASTGTEPLDNSVDLAHQLTDLFVAKIAARSDT